MTEKSVAEKYADALDRYNELKSEAERAEREQENAAKVAASLADLLRERVGPNKRRALFPVGNARHILVTWKSQEEPARVELVEEEAP